MTETNPFFEEVEEDSENEEFPENEDWSFEDFPEFQSEEE